jgi:hypothetical protein
MHRTIQRHKETTEVIMEAADMSHTEINSLHYNYTVWLMTIIITLIIQIYQQIT